MANEEAREALARLLSAIRVDEPEANWNTAGSADHGDADKILASDWLAARDAEMRAEGIRQAEEQLRRWMAEAPSPGHVWYSEALRAIDALGEDDRG